MASAAANHPNRARTQSQPQVEADPPSPHKPVEKKVRFRETPRKQNKVRAEFYRALYHAISLQGGCMRAADLLVVYPCFRKHMLDYKLSETLSPDVLKASLGLTKRKSEDFFPITTSTERQLFSCYRHNESTEPDSYVIGDSNALYLSIRRGVSLDKFLPDSDGSEELPQWFHGPSAKQIREVEEDLKVSIQVAAKKITSKSESRRRPRTPESEASESEQQQRSMSNAESRSSPIALTSLLKDRKVEKALKQLALLKPRKGCNLICEVDKRRMGCGTVKWATLLAILKYYLDEQPWCKHAGFIPTMERCKNADLWPNCPCLQRVYIMRDGAKTDNVKPFLTVETIKRVIEKWPQTSDYIPFTSLGLYSEITKALSESRKRGGPQSLLELMRGFVSKEGKGLYFLWSYHEGDSWVLCWGRTPPTLLEVEDEAEIANKKLENGEQKGPNLHPPSTKEDAKIEEFIRVLQRQIHKQFPIKEGFFRRERWSMLNNCAYNWRRRVEVPPEYETNPVHVPILQAGSLNIYNKPAGIDTETFIAACKKASGMDLRSVSRLDKGTSGCLVIALETEGFIALKEAFSTVDWNCQLDSGKESMSEPLIGIDKWYVCLCEGHVPAERLPGDEFLNQLLKTDEVVYGSSNSYSCEEDGKFRHLARMDAHNNVLPQNDPLSHLNNAALIPYQKIDLRLEEPSLNNNSRVRTSHKGKPAVTFYCPLRYYQVGNEKYTLVLCKPITGRKHQIRVHMRSLGHSIVGDTKYCATTERAISQLENRSNNRLWLHNLKTVCRFKAPKQGDPEETEYHRLHATTHTIARC